MRFRHECLRYSNRQLKAYFLGEKSWDSEEPVVLATLLLHSEIVRNRLERDRSKIRLGTTSSISDKDLDVLTTTELEVFDLLIRGLDNKSIGRKLGGKSSRTVEKQVGSILKKFGFANRKVLMAAVV